MPDPAAGPGGWPVSVPLSASPMPGIFVSPASGKGERLEAAGNAEHADYEPRWLRDLNSPFWIRSDESIVPKGVTKSLQHGINKNE